MPIYEYRCTACPLRATLLLHVDDRDKPQRCVCGAPLERLISADTSFVLIGPRWARDGYSEGGGGDES